ncbi:MAG: ABC transporter substrate binding protein [Rhodocyclaceae bacterium]
MKQWTANWPGLTVWQDIAAVWRHVKACRRGVWRTALYGFLGLMMVAAAAALQPGRGIAVVYPDIGEPYRSIFAKIIEGIEEQTKSRVPSFAIGASPNLQEIAGELSRQDIRVVIALGRNGLKFTASLDRDIGIVAGGVLSIPETEARNISVHSLAPEPGLLFARLNAFMPGARRVFVVYDPNQNDWLMRLAKEAARERGLELVSFEASDLKTALRLYQNILANADPRTDALWLPQDSTTVDDGAVLPLVLQETWTRNLAFFSSNVAHVRRGALFSLYPDNVEIGRHLANSALGYIASNGQGPRGVLPLKAVLLAVNVRTASHLGVNLAGRQNFDLVFPER